MKIMNKVCELINVINLLVEVTGMPFGIYVNELQQIMEFRLTSVLKPTKISNFQMINLNDKFLEKRIGKNLPSDVMTFLQSRMKKRDTLDIWQKRVIYDRDNKRCQICGESINSVSDGEFDHIRSVFDGGKTYNNNIQLLCSNCNRGKGQYTYQAIRAPWRHQISENVVRVAVLLRDKKCRICHSKPSDCELQITEIIPFEQGGRWIYDNLQAICIHCFKKW